MALAGFARTVLLPVAQAGRTAEDRMSETVALFGGDQRFLIGYSLPNTLSPDEVEADVRRGMQRYGVQILKVHPNISGHDLTISEGRERVNALLSASRRTALPVILHGGPSPYLSNPDAARFAVLENLALLELDRTDQPVIIAHGGAYGISAPEVEKCVLPALRQLMDRFAHLYVDTSALPVDVLALVLKGVDTERLLFGSDALYELAWKAAVKLYWLLERDFPEPEVLFARIAGSNAERLFGNERISHDLLAAVPVFSIS
jgi:predicted TIM-barrel fold metal-dependent hydrolase